MNVFALFVYGLVKRWFLYGAFLFVFLLSAGQIQAFQTPGTDSSDKDTLRVGCELDYPPYCFQSDQGEAAGFSVELFRAAASEMGLEVEFKLGPWNTLKYDLVRGKLDALPLVGRTPERENIYDFTTSYQKMHGTIVVREGEEEIQSLQDLEGKEIAVMKGDNAEEFLRRIQLEADIIQRTTFKRALLELSQGQHDAVVMQRLAAIQLMNEHSITNLKLVGDPTGIFSQSFCFAVKKGDEDLQGLLNEGLSVIRANGTYRRLHAKWFAPIEASADFSRRFIVGGDANFPPFEYLDKNGKPAGYNVELVRAIAGDMGLNIEIKLGPWSQIRDELERGHIDAIQGMLYSVERDKSFDLSPAHTNISYVIVTREGINLPQNLKDLSGKTVLVQEGDLMHDLLVEQAYTKHIQAVKSQEEALRKLVEKEYDYVLASKLSTHYYIEKFGWENLVMSKKPVHTAEYCLAVPEGNTALLSKLTEGLSSIQATGKYREIYSRWLGVYEKREVGFLDVLKYSLFILIPLLLFLIASLLWSRTLKKKVDVKTRDLQKEISERKNVEEKLQESLDDIEMITSNVPNIIWKAEFDKEGNRIRTYISETVDEFLELPPGTIQNNWEKFLEFIEPAYLSHVDEKIQSLIASPGKTYYFRYKVRKGNGEIAWFLSAGRAYKTHEVLRIFGYTSNVTKQIEAENQLKELNEALKYQNEKIASQNQKYELLNKKLNEKNAELKKSNQALEKAKENAQESDKLKSAFLANMSHEIRTPMNGIMGFTDLLKKPGLSGDKKDEYIRFIQKSGERMLDIINNLLDIAKIESGQTELNFEETSLNEVLLDVSALLKPEAEKKGISLSVFNGLPTSQDRIETDGTKLNQVLINLVNNAIKYTEEGRIELGYAQDNSALQFYVKDTGIGISEEMKEKIFERFRQAEMDITRKYEGAGLGLTISRGYVELLGGQMWVESTPGKGSTFLFTIPWKIPDSTPREKAKEPDSSFPPFSSQPTLLLVEDDPASSVLVKEMMEDSGVKLVYAYDGMEALEMVKSDSNIDLILMDVKMPVMNGYDATHEIKKIRPDLPVIIQTAFASSNDRQKAFDAGSDDFIAKPLNNVDLLMLIKRYV